MTDAAPALADPLGGYANLLARRRRLPLTRILGVVLPGVREVSRHTAPYAAWWAQANRRTLERDGPLWVVLGDSMSQGIGASAPQRGWVGQAQDALTRAGRPLDVLNLSASGARTDDVLEDQLAALALIDREPELVTVLVGSNDLLVPSRRSALPEAFARLIDRLPDGAVVGRLLQGHAAAREVNDLIDRAAAERHFVPVTVTTDWAGRVAADRFHPNDAGYAAIADAFVAAIGSRRPAS